MRTDEGDEHRSGVVLAYTVPTGATNRVQLKKCSLFFTPHDIFRNYDFRRVCLE